MLSPNGRRVIRFVPRMLRVAIWNLWKATYFAALSFAQKKKKH